MNSIAHVDKFKALAKMGYIARGVVYMVIGGLALLAAFGKGGETTDSKGAIVEIMHQPFGTFLLLVLVIGLIGFVVWRTIQAVNDTDGHGDSAKGLAIRGALLVSAITHGLLAIWATKVLLGDESRSRQGEKFLSTDMGQWIIGVVGLAFVCAGLAHIYKAWTASFERYMQIPHDKNIWANPLCRFGLASRGVVWCILAWFCISSAMSANSGEIKGMVDALELLRESSYGIWLFGIVAAGLFAFGVYSVLEAIYRRIDVDTDFKQGLGNLRESISRSH
ncbi:MAG TPA: DUF1206 domain-containing protein [Cellvibrio sp.]|nr:DUF1206 domain-containing protein [Cellvibrio sp.]